MKPTGWVNTALALKSKTKPKDAELDSLLFDALLLLNRSVSMTASRTLLYKLSDKKFPYWCNLSELSRGILLFITSFYRIISSLMSLKRCVMMKNVNWLVCEIPWHDNSTLNITPRCCTYDLRWLSIKSVTYHLINVEYSKLFWLFSKIIYLNKNKQNWSSTSAM